MTDEDDPDAPDALAKYGLKPRALPSTLDEPPLFEHPSTCRCRVCVGRRRMRRFLNPADGFHGAIRERRPDGTYLPFNRVALRTCPRCGREYIPASIHHVHCNLQDCRTTFIVPPETEPSPDE